VSKSMTRIPWSLLPRFGPLIACCRFLWVKLQLGTLCLVEHEEGIKAILQDLPKDLDETYARLLQRLSRSKSQVLIRRMFECILAARRPLTMDELCEGMAFTFEDRYWDAEKIPMNNLDVISTYGGLVICDEKTRAIQFAHYTVQQYLLDDRVYQLNMADANAHLGEVCIAYLWFEDFNTQVAPNGSMKATETMISPVSPLRSPLDPTQHSMDLSSITIGFRQTIIQPSFEKFKLLRYARRNWLWHAARFTQSEKPSRRDILFQILATQKQLPFEFKPWPADIFLGNPYPDLVGWAIVNNNPTLIKSLAGFDPMFNFKEYIRDSVSWVFKGVTDNISTEQQASIAYTQDTWNENFPMHGWMYSRMLIACRKGNMAILDLCRPDLDNTELPWVQFRGHLILEAASTNQHAIIESFNLGQGRTNDQCRSFATAYAGHLCNALERAALGGHIDMVQKLGRAGWSASNIFGSDPSMGMCALHNAIMGNNSDVVEALLAALEITVYNPSQPMSQDDSRIGIKTSAFCKAASSGNVAVVKIFLAGGASPVATGNNGMCPYMQAIKDGQMNIFELLFPLDGCGGAENSTGLPLSMAAANGQAKIVDFLISKGANVFPSNALDPRLLGLKQGSNTSSPTPLYAASANGHYAIVQKLLSAGAGADVMSARDLPSDASGSEHSQGLYCPDQEPSSGTIQDYQRPLGGAALNGHFRVVQLLLKAQALVNPTDLSENSPLLLALIGGHAEVANLLSSKSAEIQNKESAEQALLSCSMGQGGTNALGLLIEYGISSDCKNFMGESCLHIATTAGLTDIMKGLIEGGADINIRDHAGQTPLMRACSGQKFRAAWILVNLGANLSAKDNAGNSALSYASVSRSPQIVQLLLTNGAPVNSPNLVRQTPLLEACLAGDQAVVKILLSHGASIRARTGQSILHKAKRIPRGYTPLMIATIMNDSGVIETLCAKSKKRVEDIEFEQRRTSLLLAAEKGNLSTFHALVKGGASLKAKSSAGLSVLNFAINGRNVEVLKYLIAVHKRELKTKIGLFSPQEISAAIADGDALPGDVLLKLQNLGVRDEVPDCIPIVDPLEELY
jgi:ankyrin repeat protein